MQMLHIKYENPQSVYFPGQTVTGQVLIETKQTDPIKARFLKICIHGNAETHWTESESRSRTNSKGESESYTENVDYSARVVYMEGESMAWTSTDGKNRFPTGLLVFPFAFTLPLNCPPSFEGFYGCVRYSVHVELDRPWKFNKRAKSCFSVVPPFDLNLIPLAANPMIETSSKNTGLIFKNGIVTMTVNLPKRGFVPGEYLLINVNIDNGSKKPAVCLHAKLNQNSTYHARRGFSFHRFDQSYDGFPLPHCSTKHEKKLVAEWRENIQAPPKSKFQTAIRLRIPPVVSSFNTCPILSVEYSLSIHVATTSTFGSTVKCKFPLIIGTVPIRQYILPTIPGIPYAPPPEEGPSAPPDYDSSNPDAPPPYLAEDSEGSQPPPPSYEESMYGVAGTTKNADDAEPFAPRYPVYTNLQPNNKSSDAQADALPVKM